MRFKSLTGKLTQLYHVRLGLWGAFIVGWLRRSRGDAVPCALPQARKLIWVPKVDFYESYVFFAENPLGRAELEFFLDQLHPGDVVYDIGGFRGVYSAGAVGKLPGNIQAHVFEALPRNINAIRRIIEINRLESVTVIPLAVSDGFSIAGSINPTDGMLRLGDLGACEAVQFKSITVDDYVKGGAAPPTAMKIDVDGYELQVLSGARETLMKFHPRIWIEIHPHYLRAQNHSLDEVMARLQEAGYQITPYADREWESWDTSFHAWCVSSERCSE